MVMVFSLHVFLLMHLLRLLLMVLCIIVDVDPILAIVSLKEVVDIVIFMCTFPELF